MSPRLRQPSRAVLDTRRRRASAQRPHPRASSRTIATVQSGVSANRVVVVVLILLQPQLHPSTFSADRGRALRARRGQPAPSRSRHRPIVDGAKWRAESRPSTTVSFPASTLAPRRRAASSSASCVSSAGQRASGVFVFIVASAVVDAARASPIAGVSPPRASASSVSRVAGGRIDDDDVRAALTAPIFPNLGDGALRDARSATRALLGADGARGTRSRRRRRLAGRLARLGRCVDLETSLEHDRRRRCLRADGARRGACGDDARTRRRGRRRARRRRRRRPRRRPRAASIDASSGTRRPPASASGESVGHLRHAARGPRRRRRRWMITSRMRRRLATTFDALLGGRGGRSRGAAAAAAAVEADVGAAGITGRRNRGRAPGWRFHRWIR